MKKTALTLFSLYLLICSKALLAMPIDNMVIFGDSLSDNGNLFAVTGQPPAPYFDGRFSNGPVFPEYLGDLLGLAPVTHSVLGGNNFAWGGARAGHDVPVPGGLLPGITRQIGHYVHSLQGGPIPDNTLVVMNIGNNDVADAIDNQLSTPAAIPFFQNTIDQILDGIVLLNQMGVNDFLIPLVPDWSVAPRYLGDPTASELSSLFNVLYSQALGQLGGIDITIFDTTAFFLDNQQNFANSTESCLAGGCQNPQDYLFFDEFHPSTMAHFALAQGLFDAISVPVPSTLLLLFAGIWLVRRKRHRAV